MMGVSALIRKSRIVINNPKLLLVEILYLLSPLMKDKLYIKLLFPLSTGYQLDLKNPQTYNEKLQWLKLYYRNPLYPKLVDKYEYKKYVSEKIGKEYVIKNYGVWNSFEEIDFSELPNQFVLKTTHDQGGVVVCRDKDKFNFNKAREKLNNHLNHRNLFYFMREWPYKKVVPRIIAEEYLVDESGIELKDYKFYCFNGEPKVMYIAHGRQSNVHYLDYFDMDFVHLDINRRGYVQSNKRFKRPENWELMVQLSKKLSSGHPHVRIDFYNVYGKLYLGEFTLFQGGGMMPFYPIKWDYEFGSYLDLPHKNNL